MPEFLVTYTFNGQWKLLAPNKTIATEIANRHLHSIAQRIARTDYLDVVQESGDYVDGVWELKEPSNG